MGEESLNHETDYFLVKMYFVFENKQTKNTIWTYQDDEKCDFSLEVVFNSFNIDIFQQMGRKDFLQQQNNRFSCRKFKVLC